MIDPRTKLKHTVNMEIAKAISKLSTCAFTSVGAVIVDPSNNRVISTGYNGSAPGAHHCNELIWADTEESREEHKKYSDENEIHAEINAILNAAKNGAKTAGCILYTTVSPCKNCAKHLAAAGIKDVYYDKMYWRSTEEDLEQYRKNFKLDVKHLK